MAIIVAYSVVAHRIAEALNAITVSEEWRRYSPALPKSNWVEGREPFRPFFDVYEGIEGDDWLGVMEWAIIEQMREIGSGLIVSRETVDEVIARMARHPDICLTR